LQPTAANIKAAERLMEDVRRKIAAGVFNPQATFPKANAAQSTNEATFSEYAKLWLETQTGTPSTVNTYATGVRFWERHLGPSKLLVDVRHSDLKKILKAASERTSGKTLNNYLIVVRGVFKLAAADGLLPRDKLPSTDLENMSYQTKEPDPLEMEEVVLVLEHMRDRYPEEVLNYFEFAFCTGMRPSEIVALGWDKIDWRKATALVNVANVEGNFGDTKTHTVRHVDLTPRAIAVLHRQKPHTFMKGTEAAIFNNPSTGKPWADEQSQRRFYWVPTLKALGMRQRACYQTRHTFATLALMAGVNPAYIARQLGHANMGMLLRHYGRWIDGADKGVEAKKMADLFGPELAPGKGLALKSLK
jgi:integrase